jgi:hypothetical protein
MKLVSKVQRGSSYFQSDDLNYMVDKVVVRRPTGWSAAYWPHMYKYLYVEQINGNGELQFHRENGPAVEDNNGDKYWYKNGLLHREDGPASELYDGTKSWWINGIKHREDGPAVENANGSKVWFINGKLVR